MIQLGADSDTTSWHEEAIVIFLKIITLPFLKGLQSNAQDKEVSKQDVAKAEDRKSEFVPDSILALSQAAYFAEASSKKRT
jgi:hypothetical protein